MSKKNQTPAQPAQAVASPTLASELETLCEEYRVVHEAATADLEGADPRTRPGREMAKREAKERLEGVRRTFQAALKRGLAAIFVDGEPDVVAEFTRLAQEEGPVVAAAADALYRTIAEDVEAGMRSDRVFEPTQFARLQRQVGLVANDLDIGALPSLRFMDGAVLWTFEDVVAHARRLVRAAMGDQLNEQFLLKSVTGSALGIDYLQSVVPVVVTGATAEEREGLAAFFNQRTVHVVAERDPESVLAAFTALKQTIKKT